MTGWGQRRQTTTGEVALITEKRRVPASAGGRPDGLAANGGGYDRISLRRRVNETENLAGQEYGNVGYSALQN
jgi:hypothetical protein